MRHVDESLATSIGLEVGSVHIIGENGGDSDQLGRAGALISNVDTTWGSKHGEWQLTKPK
jgi:hypothetical protein